jgi:hypothetical protein
VNSIIEKWKVSLSPKYDTYLGRERLASELLYMNLPMDLLPSNHGVKKSFFRTMKQFEEQGVTFEEIKKSPHDMTWAVMQGKKQIGAVVAVYGANKNGTIVWAGGKVKTKTMTKAVAGVEIMAEVKRQLTDAMSNPGVNGYSFHLRVLRYLDKIADTKLPRESWGLNGSDNHITSYYYVIDGGFTRELCCLEAVYYLFGMRLKMEAVTK